jgi:glycerophosphoryl diester phosphodiesterase
MKYLASILFLTAFTVSSCKKESMDDVSNLNGGRIDVMGHGGSGFQTYTNDLPANSFTSVKKAIDGLGADGVEIDIQMSRDNVLFLYHDETLETATNGFEEVGNSDSAYLKTLKYSRSMNSSIFKDEPLVTLEEVLAHFSNYAKKPKISLDVKGLSGPDSSRQGREKLQVAKIMELVFKYNAADWICIESYSGDFLEMFRSYETNLELMADATDFSSTLDMAKKYSLDGIVIMNNKVSAEQVALAHQNNIKVVIYEVKTKGGSLDAIAKNPDAIQTDNISLLQECMK